MELSVQSNTPSEKSIQEEVTGFYNFRHLLRRLTDNMARCNRGDEKMFLILWDIDGFSRFNNDYGKARGDELLRHVADIIRKCVRAYDELFKSDDDEFFAILNPSDEKIAMDVTRRVSQTISRELFEAAGPYANFKFSMSSGAVPYPSDAEIPEALIHAATQALYKSRKIHS